MSITISYLYHQLWVVGRPYLNYESYMGWKHNCPLILPFLVVHQGYGEAWSGVKSLLKIWYYLDFDLVLFWVLTWFGSWLRLVFNTMWIWIRTIVVCRVLGIQFVDLSLLVCYWVELRLFRLLFELSSFDIWFLVGRHL